MKQKIKSKIKYIIGSVGLIIGLYSFIQGAISFFRGYRNLDLAANYLTNGFTSDVGLNGITYTLGEFYMIGLNQMTSGFYWVCFSLVMLAVFFLTIKFKLD